MIDKGDLVRYLKAYLKILTKDKPSFFVAFCDVELELLEVLQNDAHLLGGDISVAYLDSADYHEAVLLRNDNTKNKIVLLATKSVKYIDSLKHFSEYSLLPQPQSFPEPWDILYETFSLKSTVKYKRHFDTILQQKKPSLSTLLGYIRCCINPATKQLDNRLLNASLDLLGCWKAPGKDELLNNAMLKKIIRHSQPEEIDRRLSDISLVFVAESTLNKRQRQEIERMAFRLDYSNLFRKYSYEQVTPFFKKASRKARSKAAQEDVVQWLFSCQQYFDEGHDMEEGLGAFEADIEDRWLECAEESYLAQYQMVFKRFDKLFAYTEETQRFGDAIGALHDKIISISTNIRPESKKKLSDSLIKLKDEFEAVIPGSKPADDRFPFLLHHFLESANIYAQTFFNLLQSVIKDNLMQIELSSHGLLTELLQLFILQEGRYCHLPFFHPFFIVYLNKQRFYYNQLAELAGENGEEEDLDVLLGMAIHAVENLSQNFPINTLLYNGEQYRFDNNLETMPYYLSFITATGEASITSINANLIYPQFVEYIQEHPYLSRLEFLLAGDFSLDTLVTLEEKTKAFIENQDNLLSNFTLNIVTGETGKLRKQLDQMFADDQISNRIHLKFSAEVNALKENFAQVAKGKQLIFILDSQFLYTKPQLKAVKGMVNSRREKLLLFDLDEFVRTFRDSNSYVSLLWDTLHGMVLNNSSTLSRWEYNQPNPKVFGDIGLTSQSNPEIRIIIFSSNTNSSDYIFIKNHLTYSSMNNRGSDVLQMVFSSDTSADPGQFMQDISVQFPLSEVLGTDKINTLLDVDQTTDYRFDFSKFYIRFVLQGSIRIKVIVPEGYMELIDEKELKSLATAILDILYTGKKHVFFRLLCDIVENSLYAYCHTYAQAYFCHFISKSFIYDEKMDIDVDYEDVPRPKISFNSSKMKDFCNRYLSKSTGFSLSESQLFKLSHGYDIAELEAMAAESQRLSPVTDTYYQQISTLLEKVKRYEKA